ncbi:baculoviral IAP repeat-containing protein 8-like isoform X1 [Entelurus aequoreus]|uniref:baculoviral IAP repeat-containing protein 8-like isoform X1 n=2 Tax=Entelurus aequoreus TaxID=161455 RepID=UPI002B1D79A6|nr:baculoviral IAP repeat-containing protein 8-like isoform X1 [Entelurus aequoreus]
MTRRIMAQGWTDNVFLPIHPTTDSLQSVRNTVTERQVLKRIDDLHSEQMERIKNVTNPLGAVNVMSQVQRLPRRRVTRGLKLVAQAPTARLSTRRFDLLATRKGKAELKRQLEKQRDSEKQVRVDFAETLQFCKGLIKQKSKLMTQQDHLLRALGRTMEINKNLSWDLKMKTFEFISLQEQAKKAYEEDKRNMTEKVKKMFRPVCRAFTAQKNELNALRQQISRPPKGLPADKNGKELECSVCMDRKSCIVFVPCGHLTTCEVCAQAVYWCPICCGFIAQKVKTYIS